jgi:hypothetical protein
MRQAIASPLSSIRPGFKPLRPQYFLSALSRFKRIVRLLIWRPQSRGMLAVLACLALALHACAFAATQGKGFAFALISSIRSAIRSSNEACVLHLMTPQHEDSLQRVPASLAITLFGEPKFQSPAGRNTGCKARARTAYEGANARPFLRNSEELGR